MPVRTEQGSAGLVKGVQYKSAQGRVVIDLSKVVSASQDRAE